MRPRSSADVSIPGMGKLFDAGYSLLGKVIWGIAITICVLVCTIQIGHRIAEYISTPVNIDVNVVRNSSIRFPSVTICPFYPLEYSQQIHDLRLQYLSYFNISYNDTTYLESKIQAMDLLELPNIDAITLWNLTRIGYIDAHRLNKKNCNNTIYSEDLETYYGMCTTHTFTERIKYDGSNNGYEIMLHQYENYRNDVYWKNMVLLHERNDLPRHKIYLESGQVIHPKYETELRFQIKQYLRVDTRSQPCTGRRRVQNCYWRCIEQFISQNVTCKLPYMKISSQPMCSTPAEAKHTQYITRIAYRELDEGKLCPHCPRKCVENLYSMVQNVIMPKDWVWMKIMVQDNTVEVVKETPSFSFNVLLSEVGGSLGLFLGVCILTGLQILEILIVEIRHRFTVREVKKVTVT